MTVGKAAFSIPICWMRKVRLRSLESEFKSLENNQLAASSKIQAPVQGAAFLMLGLIILPGGGPSCALWDISHHPWLLPATRQCHHHSQS